MASNRFSGSDPGDGRAIVSPSYEVIPSTRGGGPVGTAVLAVTQARHCYIEVNCPERNYHVTLEVYGPQPGAPNGRPMMDLSKPTRNANATTNTIYGPGSGSNPSRYEPCPNRECRFENELINQFNMHQPPPTYSSTGPNSNTFVASIINGAGGIVVFPRPLSALTIVSDETDHTVVHGHCQYGTRCCTLDRGRSAELRPLRIWLSDGGQVLLRRTTGIGLDLRLLSRDRRCHTVLVYEMVVSGGTSRRGILLGSGCVQMGNPVDGHR
jgi:hypothetical protein